MNRLAHLFHLAFWAILSQKVRTGLLVITLAGGSAGFVLAVGVLQGFSARLEAAAFGSYAHSLVIFLNHRFMDRYPPLRLSDADTVVGALPEAPEAVAVHRQAWADIRSGREAFEVQVYGVRGAYGRVMDMPLAAGRHLTAQELTGHARYCLLGAGLAGTLFDSPQAAIGRNISLTGAPCEVVGVFAPAENQMSERFHQSVIAPFFAAGRYFDSRQIGGPEDVTQITIVLPRGASRQRALIAADRALRRAYGVTQSQVSPFEFADPNAPTRAIERQRGLLVNLLLAISAVMLTAAAAGYCAANIAAVDMRRRELALQMVYGASRRQIGAQIVMEGLIVGTVGAAIGALITPPAAMLASRALNFPFSFNAELAALTVALGVTAGLAASLWPALRAAGRPPALAVRV
jgi:putative ABC transport system permease protein